MLRGTSHLLFLLCCGQGEGELCSHKLKQQRGDTVQSSCWADVFGFLPKLCTGGQLGVDTKTVCLKGELPEMVRFPLEVCSRAHDV